MKFLVNVILNSVILLIILYFIPVLGIILSIFKLFLSNYYHKKVFCFILIFAGVILFIPSMLNYLGINNIEFLNIFEKYNSNLISVSKLYFCLGIILLVLSVILNNIFTGISNKIMNYINHLEKRDYEIARNNDMLMREKREKARNTNYVKCPSCGADNLVSDKVGVCSYCRKKLSNTKYKE